MNSEHSTIVPGGTGLNKVCSIETLFHFIFPNDTIFENSNNSKILITRRFLEVIFMGRNLLRDVETSYEMENIVILTFVAWSNQRSIQLERSFCSYSPHLSV